MIRILQFALVITILIALSPVIRYLFAIWGDKDARSHPVFPIAVNQVESSPWIKQGIGNEMHVVGRVAFSESETGDSGHCEMSVQFSGTRNKGVADVRAEEKSGRWVVQEEDFRIDGEKWRDVLTGEVAKTQE